jgi:hypothetical protein
MVTFGIRDNHFFTGLIFFLHLLCKINSVQFTLKEGLSMKNENKSRREALKLLGKTGLFLGSVPVFFTSLKINPLDESGQVNNSENSSPALPLIEGEKASISGSGTSLTVNVSGKPGKVFFVTFAVVNTRENYRRIPGSDGVITARGTGRVTINTAAIPSSKVYVKVITGEANNTTTGISETEPVVITILNGTIQAFEGTVSRPISGTQVISAQVLIAMAATRENKILLR